MISPNAMSAAVERLRGADIPNPRDEAARLARLAKTVDQFDAIVARRVGREPFSHIAGYRDFWNHRFKVTADVLDPRPDTELLVELALQHEFSRVLDLGTGSGCILISLLAERQFASGVGTDVSDKTILVAGENAEMAGVTQRVVLALSDWYDDIGGRFDLIVSNPPYIARDELDTLEPEVRDFEPHLALSDGGDGLSCYRAITAGALNHLTPGGCLMVEIGATQAGAVQDLFGTAGLESIEVHQDLNDRDRVVLGRARLE